VDYDDAPAIGTRRHSAWIPASRDESLDRILTDLRTEDAKRVDAAEGHEQASIGHYRQSVGIQALPERRGSKRCWKRKTRLCDQAAAPQVDECEPIGIVFGRDQTPCLRIGKKRRWLTDRNDPRSHANSGSSDGKLDQLAVSRGGEPGVPAIDPQDGEREFSAR